jgi:Hemerythrin HHE cation binding domain
MDYMEESSSTSKPPDIYSGIHKGQRLALFRLAMRVGALDHADKKAVEAFRRDITDLREEFFLHAEHEEKLLHPFMQDRVPGMARDLEEDHRNMHLMFDDLVRHFDGIADGEAGFERRNELCLEYYRALNRFISFYLAHIDKEEERVQPALWAVCTPGELGAAFAKILASQTPKEAQLNLTLMFSSMNIGELTDLLMAAKRVVTPQMLSAVRDIAKATLDPQSWDALRSRAGLE